MQPVLHPGSEDDALHILYFKKDTFVGADIPGEILC